MTRETKEIVMTRTQMRSIARRVLEAMNAAQREDGHTVDEVLMATAYALGASIYQRGAVLLVDQPLTDALPPLVAGYVAAQREGMKAAPMNPQSPKGGEIR